MFQWKSNRYCKFWVCVCSLSYPACNAHAPHCHLWPVWLTIYFQIISQTIFKESYLTQKGFWFPLQIMSETFVILRRIVWDINKMCIGLNVKYPLFLSNYNETWILTDFRKLFKFYKNPSSGSWVVPCGRTDRHEEANNGFSQFCESV